MKRMPDMTKYKHGDIIVVITGSTDFLRHNDLGKPFNEMGKEELVL